MMCYHLNVQFQGQRVNVEDPITGAVYIPENFLILQVTEVDFHRNVVFQVHRLTSMRMCHVF